MTKFDLIKDVDFMSEVINLESVEEVQQKFADKGVDITGEEIEELGALVYMASEAGDEEEGEGTGEELSLDNLENVAGGLALAAVDKRYADFAQDLGMSNDETVQLAHTLGLAGRDKKILVSHSVLGVGEDKIQSLIQKAGLDARIGGFGTL